MGNKICCCCKKADDETYPEHKPEKENLNDTKPVDTADDLRANEAPTSIKPSAPAVAKAPISAKLPATNLSRPITSLILVDACHTSLTVSWPETPEVERYVLQYRVTSNSKFETLSDKLTVPQARKRNLVDPKNEGFYFRAGSILKEQDGIMYWKTHSKPFFLLSHNDDQSRMEAPTVCLGGTFESLLITWKKYKIGFAGKNDTNSDATSFQYELQMRENKGGEEWKTIAEKFSGLEVRKLNLSSPHGYQFRVRLAGSISPFSSPSQPLIPIGLSNGVQQWFAPLKNASLLRKLGEPAIPLVDALGGKEFILLYATGNWDQQCRKYVSQVSNFYNSLPANLKTVEVVLLSADNENLGFKDSYANMPWLAIDYTDEGRQDIMESLGVDEIPRLAVMDGRTGRIIEQNSVGKKLDVERWRELLRNPETSDEEESTFVNVCRDE